MNDVATHNIAQGRLSRFLDWIAGKEAQNASAFVTPGSSWPDADLHTLGTAPERAEVVIDKPDFVGIRQIKPIAINAFSRFIEEDIAPINEEVPEMGYVVKNIKFIVTQAAEPVLRSFTNPLLNADIRCRMVISWIKAARGAHLIDTSQLYGVEFITDETVVGGHLVETLAVFDSARVKIKLLIDGEYAPLLTLQRSNASDPPPTVQGKTEDKVLPTMPIAGSVIQNDQQPLTDLPASFKPGTAIIEPAPASLKASTDIVVPQPSRRLVARLIVKPYGGVERSYNIGPDDFPFEISREPANGRGAEIAPSSHPGEGAKISRNRHMVLRTLVDDKFFNVDAEGRTGCFVNGLLKGARFTLHFDDWVSLGGEGPGTVAVKLERAV
jgi:hypothetical protein